MNDPILIGLILRVNASNYLMIFYPEFIVCLWIFIILWVACSVWAWQMYLPRCNNKIDHIWSGFQCIDSIEIQYNNRISIGTKECYCYCGLLLLYFVWVHRIVIIINFCQILLTANVHNIKSILTTLWHNDILITSPVLRETAN